MRPAKRVVIHAAVALAIALVPAAAQAAKKRDVLVVSNNWAGTADVVDVSVALLARRVGGVVVTSDPDDLRAVDPGLDLVTC